MPVYEYECVNCKLECERSCKIEERDDQLCDRCGGYLLRIVSLPNFVLKGTCWTRDNWTKKETADNLRKKLKEENANTQ